MTTTERTTTQRAVLAIACARPDDLVLPVASLRGAALQKVLASLAQRGLTEGEGGALKATPAAYEALGLAPPSATPLADGAGDKLRTAKPRRPAEAPAAARAAPSRR